MSVSARHLALDILVEWERGDVFAHELMDRAVHRHQLAHRDAALLQTLVFTVLRNVSLLDCLLDEICDNKHLETRIHWLLRLGAAQLLLLEMPAHAAVNETVALASEKPRGLANAVLRRADRERERLLAFADKLPLHERFSQPDWLVARWTQQLGEVNTKRLCDWNQLPADTYVRINRLHPQPLGAQETSELGKTSHPEFLAVAQPPREWLALGRCYVQDPSTAVACDLLAPLPGETILDACAAPGGKAACLAQLMGNRGRLIACDASARRAERLRTNLERLNVTIAETPVVDWAVSGAAAFGGLQFDRILVDAPCSNTGVMRRRVDVRWRLQPWFFKDMAKQQLAILQAVTPMLRPGGTLVYSTCSLDREENEDVVQALLQQHRALKLVETRTTTPWQDGVDGAYAAKLVKK
ncbi:MAG: 16S rRNA (cytosine(967)-C(5))-methyltransferase RsmB [Roseimicrobium sp.]